MAQEVNDKVALGSTDSGLVAMFRNMTVPERRTFWGCAAGWTLDGMDFMLYPLVIGTLIALWQVDRGTAGLAVTVTLLSSALGGWLAGYLADRIGRVRVLQITIVWFSFFSFLCAYAQNFDQLIVLRALLGLGFGGEWTAGAVLMAEAVRGKYRGRALGSVQSGWAVGWGLAVMLQAVLFSVLPPEQAWRWMFALGALPAFLVFFLRRYVEEPDISVKGRALAIEQGTQPSLWEIFSPGILKTTLLTALFSVGAQGGYYAVTTWVPTFLRAERDMTVVGSTGYLASVIVGSFVGYLVGGWLADRIGRRNLFFTFSIGAMGLVLIYTQVPMSNAALWAVGFPLGFFASGYYSGIGPFFAELFPTRLRGSGQGFAFNFGRGIGALFPTLVGFLSSSMTLGVAISLFAAVAYGLLFFATALLPETQGKVLKAD
ncbi:MFS transporter [Xanthobacter autotrophicus DSM 431]|uniref:MFS transporter n=1 Tax=Xanthobacter nonsaccharivorans TaxID=3119912 RepID=UPI0037280DAA